MATCGLVTTKLDSAGLWQSSYFVKRLSKKKLVKPEDTALDLHIANPWMSFSSFRQIRLKGLIF